MCFTEKTCHCWWGIGWAIIKFLGSLYDHMFRQSHVSKNFQQPKSIPKSSLSTVRCFGPGLGKYSPNAEAERMDFASPRVMPFSRSKATNHPIRKTAWNDTPEMKSKTLLTRVSGFFVSKSWSQLNPIFVFYQTNWPSFKKSWLMTRIEYVHTGGQKRNYLQYMKDPLNIHYKYVWNPNII